MADLCGAKTRGGGRCKKAPLTGKKRCRLHGGLSTGAKVPNVKNNAFKHGFYSDALQPDEKKLWDRVEIGTVDDEIKLMKIKLHRLVKLSGSEDVADLVDAAIEVTQKMDTHPKVGTFDKSEIKVKAARYGDLIIQALDSIRKLEMARLNLALGKRELDKDDAGANAVEGFEVVEYDD